MKRTQFWNQTARILKVALLSLCLMPGLMVAAETGKTNSKTTTENTKTAQKDAQLININTANEEQLQELPRIGPAMSKRILEFRKEHGEFKKLEDLMNVKGIGEKTFAKLKDLISI